MAETIQRTQALMCYMGVVSPSFGFLPGEGGLEFICDAEDEVGRGVGVNSVVFAEGIDSRAGRVHRHAGDAEWSPGCVAWWGGSERDRGGSLVVAMGVDGADIPQLDRGIGLTGREQQVLAARGEEL